MNPYSDLPHVYDVRPYLRPSGDWLVFADDVANPDTYLAWAWYLRRLEVA